MKTILYISHEGDSYGGSTNSLVNMINALGKEVDSWVVIPKKGQVEELFVEHNIKYIVIPFKTNFTTRKGVGRIFTYPLRLVRDYFFNKISVYRILKHFKGIPIDIVHSNSAVVGIGKTVAKKLNAHFVWHLREYLNLDFGFSPIKGWPVFIRRIKMSDRIICVTKGIRTHYSLDEELTAKVIYNAVMPQDGGFVSCDRKGNYFLFVGRIIKSKGIEDAIIAFSRISNLNPSIKLKIAGLVNYDYFTELKEMSKRLNILDRIEFLGFTKDLKILMNSANALLMCSKSEAFGRVTVEAMFNSSIVIGFNNAGTKEIVQDGVTGLLYDDLHGLEQKMNWVLENPNKAELIEYNARLFAQRNFSEEVLRDQILHLYKSL